MVKQTGQIIDGKQKLIELSTLNPASLQGQISALHHKKKMQVMMVVGEGTVFLLLLLFGIYKVKQAHQKEMELTNQQKNFFLSITHELKTPIAATKLQLQTLQKHKLSEEIQQQLLANALQETERLNSLIDNVLFASRLESGELVFKKEKENLSKFAQDILFRYYKNNMDKNEITLEIEEGLFIYMDKTAFPSIITNLIDNALKYSFNEKQILFKLRRQGDQILLSVSDTGCGITTDEKKKIFNRFYRSGSEDTRTAKGTGLGLYIVKDLVSNHHADITVTNNVPQGSIFSILFNAA
ncbi:MAG: senX3 2 [Bacteroidetes bacterium]|nr:senX3 2 [Bacteroidota bacterium]